VESVDFVSVKSVQIDKIHYPASVYPVAILLASPAEESHAIMV
jgi:hypothetical protein